MRRISSSLLALLLAGSLACVLPSSASASNGAAKTVRDERNDVQRFEGDQLVPSDHPIDLKKVIWTYSSTGVLKGKASFYTLGDDAWHIATIGVDMEGTEVNWMYADYGRDGSTVFVEVDGTENPDCPITGKVGKKAITVTVAASCFGSPRRIPLVTMFVSSDSDDIDGSPNVPLRSR